MKVSLSGTAREAILSGGFGLDVREPEADKVIRRTILQEATVARRGFGHRYTVELDVEQVRRLAESVEIQGDALSLGARDNPEDDAAYREARSLIELAQHLREVVSGESR